MTDDSTKTTHDLKNALLLLKNLSELFEAGFSPSEQEKKDIARELQKAHQLLKEKLL